MSFSCLCGDVSESNANTCGFCSELNKWHYNLLLTHILAIVLMIDDCNTDVHDIQNDLHLDNKVYVLLTCPSLLLLKFHPPSKVRMTVSNSF